MLAEIADGERRGVDGYVIACFGDPGLDAARELARGPVVGVAEAAFRAAQFLGRGFSVVTTLARTRGRAWDLVARYGATGQCRGVHACDIPVLEVDRDPAAVTRIADVARAALDADGSDVIVLGCAGMARLCPDVAARVGVPVVDGVMAATSFVESLVTLGLRTSAREEFAPPPAKPYSGLLRDFAVPAPDSAVPAPAVSPAGAAGLTASPARSA
jgi:allantoin racemase